MNASTKNNLVRRRELSLVLKGAATEALERPIKRRRINDDAVCSMLTTKDMYRATIAFFDNLNERSFPLIIEHEQRNSERDSNPSQNSEDFLAASYFSVVG